MRLALVLFILGCGALCGMALDRMVLKLQVGRDLARVYVFVPRKAEHRGLNVSASIGDVWSTSSYRQLDGSDAPVTHSFEFQLPRRHPFDDSEGPRMLEVRASVICGVADARSYVP